MNLAPALRIPGFLIGARASAPAVTLFGERARAETGPVPALATPAEAAPRAEVAPAPSAPAPVVFPSAPSQAESLAALERQMAETAGRVELAVERLRAVSERLAAEARGDALEIAMIVARRIVETELTVSVEAQVAFIRTAVKRLGEARAVVVKLPPPQAEALRAHAASHDLLQGVAATAHVEIVGDAALERGDCLVEGELGSVDGRLAHRLEEIRRAVLSGLEKEGA